MVTLADEIDISRGDLLAGAGAGAPQACARFEATVCWLGQQPLVPQREYLLRQATRETRVRIGPVRGRLDVQTLQWAPDQAAVGPNDIVRLQLSTRDPVAADPYGDFRALGSFILIDPAGNDTVAAGLIAQSGQ